MKTQHTPGPWYGSVTSADQGIIASDTTGETVAVCYNVRDISILEAAPEMLEALREAREALAWAYRFSSDGDPPETALEHVDAAIRNATEPRD